MEAKLALLKTPIFSLLAAQVVCLGLGLWLQDRLLILSVESLGPAMVEPPSAASAGELIAGKPAAVSREALKKTLAPLRWITFAWVAGLQSAVAYLIVSRVQSEFSEQRRSAGHDSLQRQKDLTRTQHAIIFGLAKLAESRDPETGQHLDRIAHYSTRLSVALRRLPKYRDQITPAFIRLIGVSSALHDIGKVGVEDQILLKPGALSDDERLRMQLHTRLGSDCIQEIETQLGTLNFLQMAREIALYHHERWDGRGYPTGLAGEAIPLAARIVAIADVYDALSVRRVYKSAMPHQQCVDIIRREAGKQFDPALVEVFLSIADEFAEIARQFSERSAALAAAKEEDLAPRAEAEIEQTIAQVDNLLEDCSL